MVLLTPRVLAAASTGLSKRAWCGSQCVWVCCAARSSRKGDVEKGKGSILDRVHEAAILSADALLCTADEPHKV
jgi:hypothetical protein